MKAAHYWAKVERAGDEVTVHMSDATACALADWLVGPKEVETEFGFDLVEMAPVPAEWVELAAELRVAP